MSRKGLFCGFTWVAFKIFMSSYSIFYTQAMDSQLEHLQSTTDVVAERPLATANMYVTVPRSQTEQMIWSTHKAMMERYFLFTLALTGC